MSDKEVLGTCPKCGKALQKVRQDSNSMLNSYQFDSVKAGDYFCECHNNGRGNAPYAYFWKSEIEQPLAPEAATEKCGEPAGHFIAGASWFTCVLPKGHAGAHERGGNCFAHGEYVGPQCPEWPKCSEIMAKRQVAEMVAPEAAPTPEAVTLASAKLSDWEWWFETLTADRRRVFISKFRESTETSARVVPVEAVTKQDLKIMQANERSAEHAKFPHPSIAVQVWADIDDGIADLVRYLNTLPGIRTQASCQGTLGEGGPAPYRAYVMASWPKSLESRLMEEFDVELLGEHWGYVQPKAGWGVPVEAVPPHPSNCVCADCCPIQGEAVPKEPANEMRAHEESAGGLQGVARVGRENDANSQADSLPELRTVRDLDSQAEKAAPGAVVRETSPTLNDGAALIRKIESCSGISAKLVLLANFLRNSNSVECSSLIRERDELLKSDDDVLKHCRELESQVRELSESRERLQKELKAANEEIKDLNRPRGMSWEEATCGDPEAE